MTTEQLAPVEFRGGAMELFNARDDEVLFEGPAGTGKTVTVCHLLHLLALKYPGMRGLMVRKTLTALTTSALVTFQKKVLTPSDPVAFFGGNKAEPASFRYENGSTIVVGGLDNTDKIFSSEYDFIYPNEATELTLSEWEDLTTRLRPWRLEHARIVGDCNPTHTKHWLLLRCQQGKTRHIKSRIEDNPYYFDGDGNATPEGVAYLRRLGALTGTRRQRFLLGEWVGVENAVYDNFSRDKHVAYLKADTVWDSGSIGLDYGDVHPHALCVVTRSSGGRYWVRETWSGREYDDLVDNLGRLKKRYAVNRVRVDPMLKGWERPETSPVGGRVSRADGAPGSRKNRIEYVYNLLTSGALSIDQSGPGNMDLIEEIEQYHYLHRQTDTVDDLVVARINDDRVAALEYAIEELVGMQRTDFGAWKGLAQQAEPRTVSIW